MNNLKNILLTLSFLMSFNLSAFAQYSQSSAEQEAQQIYSYYHNLASKYKLTSSFQSSAECEYATEQLLSLKEYFENRYNYYIRLSNSTSDLSENNKNALIAYDYKTKADYCGSWARSIQYRGGELKKVGK